MWKKFLAALAILGLFSMSTASALTVPAVPGDGHTTPDYISNFTVTPASFNPGAQQLATIGLTLSSNADIYIYALDGSYNFYTIEGSATVPTPTVSGNKTYQWYGRAGNTSTGSVLPNGSYKIYAFASVQGRMVDSAGETVAITSTSVVPPVTDDPVISNLAVEPLTFDAETGEDTEISFDVNQDAYLTVVVQKDTVILRNFSNYSGDDWYLTSANHSISWNGKDNNGNAVADGLYTVTVTATNTNGVDIESTRVTVDTVGPSTSGAIRDFSIDPSGTWDPTDEPLEIQFELTRSVNSLRIDAIKSGRVIEILDDTDADDDDYTETWDGTDDDGDYVENGTWQIVVRADGDTVSKNINLQYEQPTITEAFVTKTSIDPSEYEYATLVFKVSASSEVTVDVYQGNKKEFTILDEETVKKNKWYSVDWNGIDEDGDYVEEGQNWKFKITVENPVDDDINDMETVEINVEEDEVSDNKSNITNDTISPVIYDDAAYAEVYFNYEIDEAAEVFLAVYDGTSTSGNAEIELLDYVSQEAGSHNVAWNGRDDKGKTLKDGIYSYKLITKANGNHKDTEVGKFVVGNSGEFVTPEPPKPPKPDGAYCGGYYDTQYLPEGELCDALTWATDAGIVNGYRDGTFGPNNYINRAEVLKVVFEALSSTTGGVTILPLDGTNQGFWDIPDTHAWYMPYVRTAKFYGMIQGYIDGSAGLDKHVSRAEVLKFALEGAESFAGYNIPAAPYGGYADVNINDWFSRYAGVSYSFVLFDDTYGVNGSIVLNPNLAVTRSEVIKMLYRMNNNGILTGGYVTPYYYESGYEMPYNTSYNNSGAVLYY